MNSNSNQGDLKTIGFLIGGIVIGALISSGFFLAQQKKKAVDVSSAIGAPLLKVDGKVYTATDLPGDASMQYYMLQNNIYSAQEQFASQTAVRIALSNDAKKTVNAKELPKLDEVLSMPHVSDEEAKKYYDKIVAQMGKNVFGGQTFEQIKPQLEARMNQQKNAEMMGSQLQKLKDGGRFEFLLKKPMPPAVTLDLAGYPVRGNPNGTVTFVEVADYLCPHCRESEPIMESIFKEYKDKIKFVHISYPLQPTGLSGALAKGAFCANQQGSKQFWDYHSKAFQVPWEKNQVPAGMKGGTYYNNVTTEVAQTAGLDAKAFEACLESKESANYLQKVTGVFNESTGFQGTPTFYLNNQLIQASPEQLENTLRAALQNKS